MIVAKNRQRLCLPVLSNYLVIKDLRNKKCFVISLSPAHFRRFAPDSLPLGNADAAGRGPAKTERTPVPVQASLAIHWGSLCYFASRNALCLHSARLIAYFTSSKSTSVTSLSLAGPPWLDEDPLS